MKAGKKIKNVFCPLFDIYLLLLLTYTRTSTAEILKVKILKLHFQISNCLLIIYSVQ